ncbi:3-hydroxyisobutyryl-CoA hydrolase, mitochondrial isoform X1 [Ooceraea biroi]|nr:3-hydroxyisobutyryl-CoA hydrolase, mitochondrial isoform X1 [Ooceraea biroi]
MIASITEKLHCTGVSALVTRTTFRWLSTSASVKTSLKDTKETAQADMDDDILTKEIGDSGVIILNRPKTLNVLNMPMVQKIYTALKTWESSKKLVIIEGTGEKAFCAGGDVKALVTISGPKSTTLGEEFFKREYTLNHLIGTYKKPYIALINGITMGGGAGLSVHGKYRIATEKTLFAMPETAIGLFPDVGGTYFLPRLKEHLGTYLGLTGFRLKGVDVLLAGIATHFVPSEKLTDLKRDLLMSQDDRDVEKILNKYQPKLNHEFVLAPRISQIEQCFSAPSVEEIIERLRKDNSEWAQKNVEVLLKMSPSSLKITKKAIDEGSKKSLAECLEMEYRLAYTALGEESDFHEGVRALLIDKDQKPVWKPATLKDVTNEYLNRRFAILPAEKELKLGCNSKL